MLGNGRITRQAQDEEENVENGRRDATGLNQDCEYDPWSLKGSKNPRASLVTTLLIENNYIDWCRAVKISLAAKDKLDFVIGENNKTKTIDPRYKKWKRCDNMVFAWLINPISRELAQSFLYCTEAREL